MTKNALFNQGRNTRRLTRYLLLFEIFINAIQFGLIFVAIGHDANATTECTAGNGLCGVQLGVWKNMPSVSTEFMGNQSYRGAVMENSLVGLAHVQVGLTVQCIAPSNTLGANLQLQYANYTAVTHANTTNFVNLGTSVLIDNSANWPCPGVLAQNPTVVLPPVVGNNLGFEFRVMGSGGGGTGDNPRFSSVQVQLRDTSGSSAIIVIQSPSTTGFTANLYSWPYIAATAGKILNFNWIAVNSTNTTPPTEEGGTGTCTILTGNPSCNQAITFTTPFAATPIITATLTSIPTAAVLPIGTISLFSAETITV